MKKLIIRWRRLIDNNRTCSRCEGTEKEIEKAYKKLKEAFSPIGIEVVLDKTELRMDEFKINPLNSNQIWINNKPLEEWLNADVGQSQCCDVCGDEECRTLKFSGKNYEIIPEALIIKACLLAAADMISPESVLMFPVEHFHRFDGQKQ